MILVDAFLGKDVSDMIYATYNRNVFAGKATKAALS